MLFHHLIFGLLFKSLLFSLKKTLLFHVTFHDFFFFFTMSLLMLSLTSHLSANHMPPYLLN